jgi:replicative superfamily II helicase
MPIDLRKLASPKKPQKPIHPLEIWNGLDRAVGKEYLRPIQEQVLSQWFDQRTRPDTIIKMNTGTGKTLVGLMMLQSSLNEGLGPALYLCPDKYLVKQVLEQAEQFGVKCVAFPDTGGDIPSDFSNGEAILVANIKKFFNGRSVFGVKGGTRPPAEVGTILLDDAHACVEQIRSQFAIVLENQHPAYSKILTLFGSSLKQQRPGTYAEICASDYSKFLAVPYWSWLESQEALITILTEHREDKELLFTWPLLKDILPICDCVISGSKLQITARVTQPHTLPSFGAAKRKVFLSATLLDDSQLARDLGVSIENIMSQIKPNEFDDLGERLILVPADVDQELGSKFALNVAAGSTKINRVVLVSASKEGERWKAAGATAVLAENIEGALAPLRNSTGSFLVLISKYDGIDLPDAACRLLVLDGLPRGATLSDWYMQSALEGTPTINAKIAQKIEQGLGRATRGKSDYCVALLAGNDLVSFIRNKKNRTHLSPGTNAQLELGLAITKEIRDSSEKENYSSSLIHEINRCLKRDEEWKAAYRGFIEGSRDSQPDKEANAAALESAVMEYNAAKFFLKKDYAASEQETKKLLDRPGLNDRERGWFMQLAAAYLYQRDKSKALSMQKKACELNSSLLIPPEGIQYHKMADRAETQSRSVLRFFSGFDNSNALVIQIHTICDRLVFGVEAELFEQALDDVAKVIGISSSRPERTIGRGPDCLWLGPDGTFLVIEAKAGVELNRTEMYKSETEQLLHSCEWFKQEYPGRVARPLIIHPATATAHAAVFPGAGRVITPEVLDRFTASVRSFALALATQPIAAITEKMIYEQLELNKLLFDRCWSSAKKVV